MAKLDLLIKAWDSAIWEYSLVFEGLADEDVWKRPHPRLLSVGELTGHVAFYEASTAADLGLDSEPIETVLSNPAFKYYSTSVENPVALNLGAEALIAELKRIHEAVRARVAEADRDSEDKVSAQQGSNLGEYLQYRAFHAAYHAGQAYSVRHLFGQETTDN